MFTLYHSNQLDLLKELLVNHIRQAPLAHPFEQEQILVQSPGMAQWLKLELAKAFGIAANIDFPLPASFIWDMFTRVLADVPCISPYNKGSMSWQLMTILPALLDRPAFAPLAAYLGSREEILMVSGFTDDAPVREGNRRFADNWELSAQRSLTVTRTLIADGVPADAVFAAAFGSEQPVSSNANEEGRARNRRVEIAPIPKPKAAAPGEKNGNGS